ncbi:hypothetical protein RJB92_05290 [Staphylococcus hominis]|nr:hypothetical protein [Staphylococcus hominis]MCI2871577.1 hypothetical protein [Staphylococcus hominis]MCI2875823.1 hypothetical protein [Staphylococcus hominis]MCI2890541.1 hypothetical protein [Staphylococcus hominis]MDS3867630.1 hypothetical protein [Staphylococcus hominis]
MAKPVKIAVGIYLALVLLACSSYLVFILIGSLQGNDMSHSVLDTDHRYINNRSQSSNDTINKNESPHSTSNFTEIKKEDALPSHKNTINTQYKETDTNSKE